MKKSLFFLFCTIQSCSFLQPTEEKNYYEDLSADSLFSLGHLYFDSKEYFNSWLAFTYAKLKDSSNCELNYYLGITTAVVASKLENEVLHDRADSLLQLSFPCDTIADDLVYEWLGLNQLLFKNYHGAQKYFLRAIELDSSTGWYYSNLASSMLHIDNNYKNLCPIIEKALTLGDSSLLDTYNIYCE